MSEKSPPAAWSGRFNEPVAELTQRYTASIPFDHRLAPFDIEGSLAHARMLQAVGVLSDAELAAITQGLSEIRAEVDAGRFEWRVADEDVHTHVEKALTAKIGEAGKKLHTARSRNDQVATDVRLYLRAAIDELNGLLRGAQAALVDMAERHADTLMPGFTHLQVAQPVTFGHHLMAYVEMLFRDAERLSDCRRRVNRSPLGAAALAGTGFPIDREMTARLLNFEAVCENSLDAVSDRDFAVEFCSAAALLMLHLSRFAEELVLWSSPRFGFIELADRHCTGSSIMPQKKNPDIPELIRGKSGRVTGHVVALMMLVKAQPLAYNKDNQEDKEPLFDTVDTLRDTLTVLADLVRGLKVHPVAMRRAAEEGYATATDLADYLVEKGVAFRDAHEVVARAVRHAAARGVDLAALPRDELRAFSPRIEDDVAAVLMLEGSVARRDHVGGTAPAQVRAAVARARARLG